MMREEILHTLFYRWRASLAIAMLVLLCCTGGAIPAGGQKVPDEQVAPPMTAEAIDGGARFHNDREIVLVTFCEDGVVHVVAKPAESHTAPAPEPWITAPCKTAASSLENSQGRARIHSGPLTSL